MQQLEHQMIRMEQNDEDEAYSGDKVSNVLAKALITVVYCWQVSPLARSTKGIA